MNNEQESVVNVATSNKPADNGMPLLQLSMSDKLYLAISHKYSQGGYHYVFSLFCREKNPGSYNLFPETGVATFKDLDQAELYRNTLLQVQKIQSKTVAFQKLQQMVASFVDSFNQQTR